MTIRKFNYWFFNLALYIFLCLLTSHYSSAQNQTSKIDILLGEKANYESGFLGVNAIWIDYIGTIYPEAGNKPAIIITAVEIDSPAHKAGLTPGTIIRTINEVEIYNGYLFRSVLQQSNAGDQISLGIQRLEATPKNLISKIKSYSGDPENQGFPEFLLGELNRSNDFDELQPDHVLGYVRNISEKRRNLKLAIEWYVKSINYGNHEAMYSVAELFNWRSSNRPDTDIAALFLAHAIKTGGTDIHLRFFYAHENWRTETIKSLKRILLDAGLYGGQINGDFESDIFKTALVDLRNGKGNLPRLPLTEIQKIMR